MNGIKITGLAAFLLLLAGCAPGTYNLSQGYYYPTPKNETVEPWQKVTVQPPPANLTPKQPVMPPGPKPNDRVIVVL